jgi:hypothetical protein
MYEDLVEFDEDDLLLLITKNEGEQNDETFFWVFFTSFVFSVKCCFNV